MPLTIAIVGFGRMAQRYYAPALNQLEPDARYVIVDPAVESCDRAQRIFPQARCFGAIEGLADIALAGALIASPPTTHFHAWRTLAARGVPVFMEKPFPLPHEIKLLETLPRSHTPLMVNFNRRFWPPYQRLLAAVSSGAIGSLRSASFELTTDPLQWDAVTDHRATASEALQDLGGHVVDLVVRLFSSLPAEISAAGGDGAEGRGLSLRLGWLDGRSAACVVGYGRSARETMHVLGAGGELCIDNPHGRLWKGKRTALTRWGSQFVDLVSTGTYGLYPRRSLMRWTTRAALQALFRGIRTGEVLSPGIDDALRVARVLAAAQRSLITGGTIDLRSFQP